MWTTTRELCSEKWGAVYNPLSRMLPSYELSLTVKAKRVERRSVVQVVTAGTGRGIGRTVAEGIQVA
jgi:hypothetical protein